MKATIEIDATPQEMRAMLGLPDVEPLQREVLEKMREKTLSAIDANDPMQLMKIFMPATDQFKSIESLQASFWEAMGKSMNLSGGDKEGK
jgi:hypothetical protein